MKKLLVVWTMGFLMFAMSSVAIAVTVGSETILTNPASTENLWAYSYDSDAGYISSSLDYPRASDPLTDAVFQGYVTGDYGPWSPSNDSFSSGGSSDVRTVHVFETYITSSIHQTVYFATSGDDGHSIFVDDVFLDGDGYNITSFASLVMEANTLYKLAFAGSNYTGPWSWWFTMRGNYDESQDTYGWRGPISEGSNIYMNASQVAPAPVPEPSTILLLGSGLLGLGWYGRKRKKA